MRKVHPHNKVWLAKYKAQILSIDTIDFCFKNDLGSIQVTSEDNLVFIKVVES